MLTPALTESHDVFILQWHTLNNNVTYMAEISMGEVYEINGSNRKLHELKLYNSSSNNFTITISSCLNTSTVFYIGKIILNVYKC